MGVPDCAGVFERWTDKCCVALFLYVSWGMREVPSDESTCGVSLFCDFVNMGVPGKFVVDVYAKIFRCFGYRERFIMDEVCAGNRFSFVCDVEGFAFVWIER